MGLTGLVDEKQIMDDISVILRRFGDEQSTLLDRYERLSFEVQMNQAILGRSMSAPGVALTHLPAAPPPLVRQPVRQGPRRVSGFNKVMKKLLKPFFFGKKNGKGTTDAEIQAPEFKKSKSRKLASRSLRL